MLRRAAPLAAAAAGAAAEPALLVTGAAQYLTSYADHGTGSRMDLSLWHPWAGQDGWKSVGDLCDNGYSTPTTAAVVVKAGSDKDAVRAPKSMRFDWKHDRSPPGGFYTAVCDDGYAALGLVGTGLVSADGSETTPTPDQFPDLVCVKEKYTAPVTDSTLCWNDHGTGCKWSGEVLFGATFQGLGLPCQGAPNSYPSSITAAGLNDSMACKCDSPQSCSCAIGVLPVLSPSPLPAPTPAPAPVTPPPPPASATPPEQVHLALGKTEDTAIVAWATPGNTEGEVQWGTSPSQLSSHAAGDSRIFTQDSGRTWYTHVATMTGLKKNTQYFYKVGGMGLYSQVFNYTHFRARKAGEPYRHVLFGDMGASCAFTLCDACTKGSENCDAAACAGGNSSGKLGLVGEVLTGADMWLHVGDFAYNLDSNGGKTGDQFMRNIEQIAATVPYMVSHGNHEDGSASLAHFVERFRSQPSNAVPATFTSSNGETTNTMYFSWDFGLVHYIAVSTELWFGIKDDNTNLQSFLAWVRKDLEAANKNRGSVPWIVIHGHRSIYCSCDGDCDGAATKVKNDMEQILFDYGVDFFINGHEHNYERSYPVYQGKSDKSNVDPKATVYIVTGAAGSSEMHEPFTRDQPTWSAYRSNHFSYSRMWVYNATHIHWQQVETDPTDFPNTQYGQVVDDTWYVQSKHGPFNLSHAPKGEAFPKGTDAPGRQVDHWLPLLGLDHSSGRRSEDLIREFRAEKGESAWIAKLQELMAWANKHLGGKAQWEDVREDGSSDGAWFKWKGNNA